MRAEHQRVIYSKEMSNAANNMPSLDAAPSATSLFPINYSPTKCLQKRGCSSRCDGGTGQGAAALHPAGLTLTSFLSFFLFFFFFTSLNWRLDKQPCRSTTEAFDLDEGRNVEYEPEMTSQAGLSVQKSELWRVCYLGPRVCTDPSCLQPDCWNRFPPLNADSHPHSSSHILSIFVSHPPRSHIHTHNTWSL